MLRQVHEGVTQMRGDLAAEQSVGVRCCLLGILCSLAEAQARAGHPEKGLTTPAEALASVEQTDERTWQAELHRLRAESLLMQGEDADAEASLHQAESGFQHAVQVARRRSTSPGSCERR